MTKKELLESYKIDLDDSNENNFDGLYELFLDYEIATENELNLVCSINGSNIQSLLDILYVKNGLRSIEQLIDELKE